MSIKRSDALAQPALRNSGEANRREFLGSEKRKRGTM